MRRLGRLLRVGAALLGLALSGLALVLAILWAEHTRHLTLPEPPGPFAAGRVAYDWTDSSRIDRLAPSPDAKRELTVWIWYPADVSRPSGLRHVAYMPAPLRTALHRVSGVLMSDFLTRDLDGVRPHAFAGPPLSTARRRYPVVLFKPGIGALALQYTSLAEDLASRGWVVVASDSPFSTSVVVFHDGRVVRGTTSGNPGEGRLGPEEAEHVANGLVGTWAADERFEMDELERLNTSDPSGRFTERLALDSVGVFGHSFGGAAAAQFCHDDPRCGAAVDIDGQPFGDVLRTGLEKPFLLILSEHPDTSSPGDRVIRRKFEALLRNVPNRPSRIEILGSRHFNFSDQALLKERHLFRLFGAVGTIGGRRGLAVTAAYVDAFFDTYLLGIADPLMSARSPRYPEVRFVRR